MSSPRGSKRKALQATTAAALLGVLVPVALATRLVPSRHTASVSSFTIAVAPRSRTVAPGATTTYTIHIHRVHFTEQVALWIGGGLPPNAYARVSRAPTRRASVILIVATSRSTPGGRYRISLRGTSGRRSRTITVMLTIARKRGRGKAGPVSSGRFTVVGSAGGLQPGTLRSLNLAITNPNRLRISVTSLTVSLQRVSAPNATRSLPCTLADFTVEQFSGRYPLIVSARSTRTLSALRIPTAEWPQVAILDRPVDQDGCKGASVTLAYGGTARLG